MSSPDLSICILNWNSRDLLRDCLRSLLDTQRRFDGALEIIVADNASEDGSPDMVREEFPQVTLIQNERNLLFAAGNNVAAQHASGRYLLFLNSDTVVDCAELAKMVSFMDDHPSAGACGPAEMDDQGNVADARLPRVLSPWYFLCGLVGLNWKRILPNPPADGPVRAEAVSGACLMVRSDLWETIGGFDERFPLYGNDNDICLTIRQSGHEVWYLPHCRIVHLGGRTTAKRERPWVRRHAADTHLALLDKHYPPLWAALLRALFVAAAWRRVVTRGLFLALTAGLSAKRKRRWHEGLTALRALREVVKGAPLPPAGGHVPATPRPQPAQTKAPDLSVCILNWNTKDLLRGCLRSLFDTRERLNGSLEVIVADNASDDGSAEMVRAEFPGAKLVQNQRNLLFAAGNNAAAAHASGRHLLFLNSDTAVDCDQLGKMVAFMDDHPAAGICGPLHFDGDGNISRALPPVPTMGSYVRGLLGLDRLRASRYQPGHPPVLVDAVSGACLMVRATLARRLGFFDEQFDLYANDSDLCFRARQAGYQVWHLPDRHIVHYGGGSLEKVPSDAIAAKIVAARLAFISKHYRPVQAWLLRSLLAAQLYRWVLTRALSHGLTLGRSQRRRRRLREALRLLRAFRHRQ